MEQKKVQTSRHFCYRNRTFRTFQLNQLPTIINWQTLDCLGFRPRNDMKTFRPNVLKKGSLVGFSSHILKKSLSGLKIGGGGIRTHGTRERSTVFKTAPINRSGTPPFDCWMYPYITISICIVKFYLLLHV